MAGIHLPGVQALFVNERLATRSRHSMRRSRQRAWLERSRGWALGFGNSWRPRGVLGAGTFGIIGLWDYIGQDNAMPRSLAVKQSFGSQSDANSLRWESKLLSEIRSTGTNHVVKIYKAFHQDGGTGTSEDRDPLPYDSQGNYSGRMNVSRIYLEYCENGTLDKAIADHARQAPDGWIAEELIWRILDCLARALMVLERGSEELATRGGLEWDKICHFDIKPGNILVGERDAAHQRWNVVKLADFGLALTVPRNPPQNWIRSTQWRGTHGYLSPEQMYEHHTNRDIGPATNVWAIGAVIYGLLMRGKRVPQVTHAHTFDGQTTADVIMGGDMLAELEDEYSKHMIEIVWSCLAWDPTRRTTAENIIHITTQNLALYDEMNGPHAGIIPPNAYTVLPNGTVPFTAAEINQPWPEIVLPQPRHHTPDGIRAPPPTHAFAHVLEFPPHVPLGALNREHYPWRVFVPPWYERRAARATRTGGPAAVGLGNLAGGTLIAAAIWVVIWGAWKGYL